MGIFDTLNTGITGTKTDLDQLLQSQEGASTPKVLWIAKNGSTVTALAVDSAGRLQLKSGGAIGAAVSTMEPNLQGAKDGSGNLQPLKFGGADGGLVVEAPATKQILAGTIAFTGSAAASTAISQDLSIGSFPTITRGTSPMFFLWVTNPSTISGFEVALKWVDVRVSDSGGIGVPFWVTRIGQNIPGGRGYTFHGGMAGNNLRITATTLTGPLDGGGVTLSYKVYAQ